MVCMNIGPYVNTPNNLRPLRSEPTETISGGGLSTVRFQLKGRVGDFGKDSNSKLALKARSHYPYVIILQSHASSKTHECTRQTRGILSHSLVMKHSSTKCIILQ